MAVLVLSLTAFALFFMLMSVRLIFVKDGEFRGTCASQSPWLTKDGIVCGYCGRTLGSGETCDDPPDKQAKAFPEVGTRRVSLKS